MYRSCPYPWKGDNRYGRPGATGISSRYCRRSEVPPLLNRPQRMQRGSLSLGQALHPADIQALVGPIAPQGSLQLATREIPHLDRAVIAPTGEPSAIPAALE